MPDGDAVLMMRPLLRLSPSLSHRLPPTSSLLLRLSPATLAMLYPSGPEPWANLGQCCGVASAGTFLLRLARACLLDEGPLAAEPLPLALLGAVHRRAQIEEVDGFGLVIMHDVPGDLSAAARLPVRPLESRAGAA